LRLGRLLARKSARNTTCHIFSKACLTYKGMNDRFHVMQRKRGLALLASRLYYYRTLLRQPKSSTGDHMTKNTERFELQMVSWLGMQRCEVPPSVIPAIPARLQRLRNASTGSTSTSTCFMTKELAEYPGAPRCLIPEHHFRILKNHRCGHAAKGSPGVGPVVVPG